MTEYKCPYCGSDSYATSNGSRKKGKFPNWKSVRNHTSLCKSNSKSYVICENYGPILLNVINSYESIQHFRKDFPDLSFSSSIWKSLRKNNKTLLQLRIWNPDSVLESIREFYKNNNRVPQKRETLHHIQLPDYVTTRKYFGTWNKAILAAGFEPNENDGFGKRSKAKDGVLYRSQAEVYFVNNFLFEKYTYIVEPKYLEAPWVYDFYINETQEFIEIDGGLRPQRMFEKIEYNKSRNIKFKVITTDKLYLKDFKY